MPCILKERTKTSPGIVTFTHNEVLHGVPSRSKKANRFLTESHQSGAWILGTHVQGFCDDLGKWPEKDWESFFLWPEEGASFLSNIAREKILAMNCINFLPPISPPLLNHLRTIDVCIISRASQAKKIYETLLIVRRLMDLNPKLQVAFIVPDQRDYSLGPKMYDSPDTDRRFYELPRTLFSARELKQISFVCSSEKAFGKFPLASELVWDVLKRSKFLLSTSLYEGTPRTFGEALLCGTPCAIDERTHFGMRRAHNESNTLWLKGSVEESAQQLHEALRNDGRYRVDDAQVRDVYSSERNQGKLKSQLSHLIEKRGLPVNGAWYLEDLHLRLPGHGQKRSFQIQKNEDLFFEWFENVLRFDPYDEDKILDSAAKDVDSISSLASEYAQRIKRKCSKISKKLRKHPL